MKLTHCPRCGGLLTGESIGWKCQKCKGFIDMQGNFHEHKEEPFMPPITNEDRFLAMSVQEKAEFFVKVVSDGCPPAHDWDCKKDEDGWDACAACWARWLQQPAVGMSEKECLFCVNSMSADAMDGSQVLVCFDCEGHEGKEMQVDVACANYKEY